MEYHSEDRINQVLPGLFIGNINCATDDQQLADHDIQYVLNMCRTDSKAHWMDNNNYLHAYMHDGECSYEKFIDFMKQGSEFLHKSLSDGANILVHCKLGKSRSASVIIYYLMFYQGYSLDLAMQLLKEARPTIELNIHFTCHLTRYETLINS